jgi:hypothetical protein
MHDEVKWTCVCLRHGGVSLYDDHLRRDATGRAEASNGLSRFLITRPEPSTHYRADRQSCAVQKRKDELTPPVADARLTTVLP